MHRTFKWALFAVFCLISWVAAGWYLFIAGWAPCGTTGHCTLDGIVSVGIFLLIPVQAAAAAYLRYRERD
jgi:hypothetical protein